MIDPTIDPITGVPALTTPSVVQQIPLGVQTFPWQDLNATERPTRNPIYGDDILPVASFTVGQHPSTGSAQTIESDGKHALKVALVSGGSSGSAPVGLSGSVYVQNAVIPNITPTEFTSLDATKLIYALFFTATCTALATASKFVSIHLDVWNKDGNTGPNRNLGMYGLSTVGGLVNEVISFPTGLSLPLSGFTSPLYSVVITATGGDIVASFSLLASP